MSALTAVVAVASLLLILEIVRWSVARANRKRAQKLDDTLRRHRIGL